MTFSASDKYARPNNFAVLDMPAAPVIIDQQVTSQIVGQQRQSRLYDAIRQTYITLLTSNVDSSEIYLSLANIYQQIEQGILLDSYRPQIIQKLLEIVKDSESSVVNQRALKLLQYFVEDDTALIAQILSNDPLLLQDGGHGLLGVLCKVLTSRCVHLSVRSEVLLCNDELIECVVNLLFAIFNNDFVFDERAAAAAPRTHKNIGKIYSATVSKRKRIFLNVKHFAHKQI